MPHALPELALAGLALAACTGVASELPVKTEVTQQVATCADGPTTYGIDVSRFQGTIDWQKVADADVKFAYIQISRSLTDIDQKFVYNWRRAKEVGILRGAYQRFQPDQDVIGQAELFLEKLGPYQQGDLPPLLDVEDNGGLSASQIAQRVKQWLDHVEPVLGLRPIIYTGYYFWRDEVGGADFSDYPLWIANYGATCPLVPQAWTRWAFHQYSSTATIPGITANTVDVNRFNGTLTELKAMAVAPVCGDGTCNGVENADTCATECAPCQTIAGVLDGSEIVDDTGACFRAGGDPQFIHEENAGYGSTLKWTHATDAVSASNYARWTLHFAEAGRYRLEAFTPAPYNESERTVYSVTHAGETTKLTVDQRAVDGWNLIGELDFEAGGMGQSIQANDNTGEPNESETKIVFDAIRLTRLSAPAGELPVDPEDADPAASGGCSTSRDASWLVVGAAVVVWRRRRRH